MDSKHLGALLIKNLFISNVCDCAVGAEVEDDKIELLLSELKGKDITEVIASGREKLASVPSGGGAAVAVAAAPGGGAAASAAAATETKKEEKVEEKEESDDVSLFYPI